MTNLPLIMIGYFVVNNNQELYLRTKPNQTTGFRCLNDQLLGNDSIKDTLNNGLLEKTGLTADKIELLNVTEGFNIPKDGENYHMVFIDHLVYVSNISNYKVPSDRTHKWQTFKEWLKEEESIFAPHIRNVIEDLDKKIN